ncbi:MAG: HAD family hydrolase [Caldilineaceae bacterium]
MSSSKPFDLVILDLDGTIIDLYRPGGISPVVLESIAAVQAAGIPVTIGTGRTLAYIHKNLRHLNITTPAVTVMGAVIGNPATGEVLAKRELEVDASRWIADFMEREKLVCGFYFCHEDGSFHIAQNFDGSKSQEFYDHVITTPRLVGVDLKSLFKMPEPACPIKFLSVNDLDEGADIAPRLRQAIGHSTTIVRTHPMLVEGTALGVDKGGGLRQLCDLLDIDIARVLAIGDADNDIPMLEAAGTAVAMGNATPGVIAVADWVAPSIHDDGAAVALRKFVLER